MNNKKTVFVLGAGASMPYGFPSAIQLKEQIIKKLKLNSADQLVYTRHERAYPSFNRHFYNEVQNKLIATLLIKGVPLKEILLFANRFEESSIDSIDKFLEINNQFEMIGKTSITYILRDYEKKHTPSPVVKDYWYSLFWNSISTVKVEELLNLNFTIITFNYERSLEHFLKNALKNLYGLSSEEAASKLNFIKFIHVHGQIGESLYNSSDDYGKDFKDPDSMVRAAYKIRVLHNELHGETMDDIHSAINGADNILFMGFSFGNENIRIFKNQVYKNNFIIHATSLGLSTKKLSEIKKAFPLRMEFHELYCSDLLNEVDY
jgi:hypothetical protein